MARASTNATIDSPITPAAGTAVTALDTKRRTAALSDGSTVTWKKLLLATGARAAVPWLPNVREWFVLRSQDEAERLRVKKVSMEVADASAQTRILN